MIFHEFMVFDKTLLVINSKRIKLNDYGKLDWLVIFVYLTSR